MNLVLVGSKILTKMYSRFVEFSQFTLRLNITSRDLITMQALPLHDYMSGSVLSASPDLALQQVAEQISLAHVSCAVVCEGDNRPVGVISERDLTRAYARDVAPTERPLARSAMSQGVIALSANDSCARATHIMDEQRIRRLVIVDDSNALVGIVTQSDMLRAHSDEVE
jgi:CBS domain-containing protein